MTVTTALIIMSAIALFFFVLCAVLLFKNKKEYQMKMTGTQAMVIKARDLKKKRCEDLGNTTTATDIEHLWVAELEFYQNMSETICLPTEDAIKRTPHYVTELLLPYYKALESNQNSSISPDDLKKLQLKNEALTNEIATLKASAGSITNDGADNNIMSGSTPEAIHAVLSSISLLVGQSYSEEDHAHLPQACQLLSEWLPLIEDKLSMAPASPEEDNQTQAIVEQLRTEKMSYLKKYKKSMAKLMTIYQEYASAFGLEAPSDNNLEIDEFEALIKTDEES